MASGVCGAVREGRTAQTGGPTQLSNGDSGTGQVRPAEVYAPEIDPVQIRPSQVGVTQIGPEETRVAQAGVAKVGPAEIGVVQGGPAQIGTAEDHPA